jgi:hypothetical protein
MGGERSRRQQAAQGQLSVRLRGSNEPNGIAGWSSVEGPNVEEQDAERDPRGGDAREGDRGKRVGGKGGGGGRNGAHGGTGTEL